MCSFQINGSCCPPNQLFQETVCGNFSNTSGIAITQVVWTASAGEYVKAIFEVFTAAASIAAVTGSITSTPVVPNIVAPPGFSVASSVSSPTRLSLTIPANTNGTFCVTAYRQILA